MSAITSFPIQTKLITAADVGLGQVDDISAAELRDRATHTGSQTASTISDFAEAAQDAAAQMLVAGAHTGIAFIYDDDSGRIDAVVSGGGGGGGANLAFSRNATTVTVESDTGTDAVLPVATTALAGVMSAAGQAKLDGIAAGATANASDATLLARGNHTGTQLAATISDFTETAQDAAAALLLGGVHSGITFTYNDAANRIDATTAGGGGGANLNYSRTATTVTVESDTGADAVLPAASGSLAGVMSAASQAKLDGIATGATANASDATLLARGNHTGTQAAATISDFAEAAQDASAAMLLAGSHTGIAFTYNDASNSLDAVVSGGGGGSGANLAFTRTATTVTVESDTGTDAVLPAATTSLAGVLTAAKSILLDALPAELAALQDGIQFLDEGTNLGTQGTVTSFNVTGPQTTFTRSGNALTLDIQPSPSQTIVVTSSRSLSSTDDQALLVVDSTSTVTLTVPTGLPNNFECRVVRANTGAVAVNPGGGVTYGVSGSNVLSVQGAQMTLRKRGSSENYTIVNTSFGLALMGIQGTDRRVRWLHEFGNVGNPSADHTTIIQAAIDACDSEGRILMLPPGIFNFSGDITGKGSIIGMGGGHTGGSNESAAGVLRNNAATILRRTTGDGTGGEWTFSARKGFILRGFRMETPNGINDPLNSGGDYAANSSINIDFCNEFLVEDFVHHKSRGNALLISRCSDWVINRCTGERLCKDTFHVTNGGSAGTEVYGRGWRMNCLSIACMDDAFPIVSYSSTERRIEDIYDINNKVLGPRRARGYLISGVKGYTNRDCYYNGDFLPTYSSTDRLGTAYNGVGGSLAFYNDSSFAAHEIENVRVDNFRSERCKNYTGAGAVWFYHSSPDGAPMKNIRITNLHVKNPLHYGISCQTNTPYREISDVHIQGVIEGAASDAVQLDGGRDWTLDLKIKDCHRAGFVALNGVQGTLKARLKIENIGRTTVSDAITLGEGSGTIEATAIELEANIKRQPGAQIDRFVDILASVPTGTVTQLLLSGRNADVGAGVQVVNSSGLNLGTWSDSAPGEFRLVDYPFTWPQSATAPVTPAGGCTLSASSVGTARTLTGAPANTFLPTDLGMVIKERDGGGVGIVTGWTSATAVTLTISAAFSGTSLASGAWCLQRQVRRRHNFFGITFAATTGSSVTATASAAAFVSGDVNKRIRQREGDGLARITGYTSATVVTVSIINPWSSTSAIGDGEWWIEDFDVDDRCLPRPSVLGMWRTVRVNEASGIQGIDIGPHPDLQASNAAWRDVSRNNPYQVCSFDTTGNTVQHEDHGKQAGDHVRFATTGSLPGGLTAGTVYHVIAASLTADQYQVSATVGGSAIDLTGSPSGTHSVQQVDLSGFFVLAPNEAVRLRTSSITDVEMRALISPKGPGLN